MQDALDETADWPIDGYLIASPYYVKAVATRPAAAFHRAGGSCRVADRALQHSLPDRGQCRKRDHAAARRTSQHRRPEGLRRRPRAIDRAAPAAAGRLQGSDTGQDAQYYEALTDGADGAILLSAHIETDRFAAVRTHVAGRQPRRRAGVLGKPFRTHQARVRPAELAPAKYWLARTGLIARADVRLPMVDASAELAARLDAEIAKRMVVSMHAA